MANRLTRIYTRSGDNGTTGLADGSRVAKDSARMEVLGTVDELNSVIGVLMTTAEREEILELLAKIQHALFDIGGEMAIPGTQVISDAQVTKLEHYLDHFNDSLPPLEEFILPGGTPAAAHCHHARTVCRRAERRLLTLSNVEETNAASLKFLNRLSDLLFVLARTLARENGGAEVTWKRLQI